MTEQPDECPGDGPLYDPSWRSDPDRARRALRHRRHRAAVRQRFEEADRKVLEEIANRSPDWTVPDTALSYVHLGPVYDNAPCQEGLCGHLCHPPCHRVEGEWRPNSDRTLWTFEPYQLPSEDDDQRQGRAMKSFNRLADHNPIAGRVRREMNIIREVYGEGLLAQFGEPLREPDALIYCSAATEDNAQCRKLIGKAWQAEQGWWLQSQTMPFKESIPTHLATAMWAQQEGHDWLVRAKLATVDALDNNEIESIPYAIALSKPTPGDGFPPWLVLGCRIHFNAAIDYDTMRDLVREAKRKRKGVSFDCSKRLLGTVKWSASEQTFLVE